MTAKDPARRMLGISTGVVGGVLGFVLVKTVMTSGLGMSSTVSLEELTSTASRINKMLPIMVDRNTELLTTIGLPGTFVYQYRIVNISVEDVPAADLAKIEQVQRRQVTNLACTTPETRDKLLNRGVTMRYQYADAQGRAVARFDVTASDCPAATAR